MRRLWSPLVAMLAMVGAATLAGGIARAQVGDEPVHVVSACVAQTTGNLRIVTSETQCRSNERFRTWNRVGEPGSPGAAGATGQTGQAGAAGAPGLAEWTSVDGPFVHIGRGSRGTTHVSCPAGLTALAGGFETGEKLIGRPLTVMAAFPSGQDSIVGAVLGENPDGQMASVAVCVAAALAP